MAFIIRIFLRRNKKLLYEKTCLMVVTVKAFMTNRPRIHLWPVRFVVFTTLLVLLRILSVPQKCTLPGSISINDIFYVDKQLKH